MVIATNADASGIIDFGGMLTTSSKVFPAKYVVALSTKAFGVVLSVSVRTFGYCATRSPFVSLHH